MVEARRTALRVAAELLPRTDLLLSNVKQIAMSDPLLESAGRLPDPLLRSLDATPSPPHCSSGTTSLHC